MSKAYIKGREREGWHWRESDSMGILGTVHGTREKKIEALK